MTTTNPPRTMAERMLAKLRHIDEHGTDEEKRVFARSFKGDGCWPAELADEAQAILERISAGGVAPPSWGHGPKLLELLKR